MKIAKIIAGGIMAAVLAAPATATSDSYQPTSQQMAALQAMLLGSNVYDASSWDPNRARALANARANAQNICRGGSGSRVYEYLSEDCEEEEDSRSASGYRWWCTVTFTCDS